LEEEAIARFRGITVAAVAENNAIVFISIPFSLSQFPLLNVHGNLS